MAAVRPDRPGSTQGREVYHDPKTHLLGQPHRSYSDFNVVRHDTGATKTDALL